jgi:nucleotide-binding universal stress UspA family protein
MDYETEEPGLHILVAVKETPLSEPPVRIAVSIIQLTGGKITLFIAAPEGKKSFRPGINLDRYAEMLYPYPVNSCIRQGDPNEEISKEAASNDYDLVILGERPENILLKFIFSRNAERVINEIYCPVLIASQSSRPLRRFLVCEGGRSTRLLPTLTGRLASLTRTAERVLVLHVMSQLSASPGATGWELSAGAEDLIQQHTPEGDQLDYDLSALHSLGLNASVKVRHGVVVEEILSVAEEEDVDVIVMGAPRTVGWQRFLLDSPIHKIILQSQRTVMIVG